MNALVVFGIYSGGVCASPDDQLISEPIAEVHFRIRVFTKTRDLLHEYNYYGGIAFKFYLHEFARNLEQKCFGAKYLIRYEFEMRISEEFIKDRNEKSIENPF